MKTQKFSPKRLYEQVFEQLKDEIRKGVYQKGDMLPSESELIKTMGVSRVTVRQALQCLAEAGIIETRQGKGSVVVVDWKSILEETGQREIIKGYREDFVMASNARRLVEPAIARYLALHATEEDIRAIEATLDDDDSIPADFSTRREPDKRLPGFHGSLWEAMHNPFLKRTWDDIVMPCVAMRNLPLIVPAAQEQSGKETRRQHRDVFEAIKRHDSEYAYFNMMVHCDWMFETYIQYYNNFLE